MQVEHGKSQGGISTTGFKATERKVRLFYVHMVVRPGRGVLPYMGHIGMCRCEGYGFQAVYSSIGYINQSVWV